MKKDGIIRVVILTVILIICTYFSAGYAYEIYNSGLKQLRELYIDTGSINNITIDGSDFTLLFRLMGIGTNSLVGLVEFVVYCIYAVIVLVVSLIFCIPFRLISFKKITFISEKEKDITRWIYLVMIGMSIVIGLVLTHFTVIIPLLVYTAIWAVILLFIYVMPILRFEETKTVDPGSGK